MVENITNLTSTSVGFISNILHSQEFWIALIVSVVLLVVGTMSGTISKWFDRRLKRLKEAFSDVELIDDENTCRYLENPSWLRIPAARRYLWAHRALGLWKKAEKANNYEELVKSVNTNVASIARQRIKANFGDYFKSWDSGEMPRSFYIPKNILIVILDNMKNNVLDRLHSRKLTSSLRILKENDKYMLYGHTPLLAGDPSESKINSFKDLIQSIIYDEEIIQQVTEMEKALIKVVEAKRAFNKKLAVIIRDLRFRAGGL